MNYKNILIALSFFSGLMIAQSSQELNSLTGGFDSEYLESLPEDVRMDLLTEINKGNNDNTRNSLQKRPSTELSKFETIKNWENFQKQQALNENLSERYGINLFSTMQSSFMPINEPNFGSEYILDYGDFIEIRAFGNLNKRFYEEIKRDGSVTIDGIGRIKLAGLNFDQAVSVLNTEFKNTFIGVEIVVTLSELRDIKILVTGNASYPGMYTISGNSNILQALNIAGGIKESGSFREIVLIRDGLVIQNIDLYKALIFGDTSNIPTLRSGDSINIKPALNLVRAGTGFVNEAVFELKDGETYGDLLKFSGGVERNVKSNNFTVIQIKDSKFEKYETSFDELINKTASNLDTVSANIEKIGVVEITGSVKNPGNYSISSNDRLSDLIIRAGGYTESAYIFGGSLFRDKAKKLEKQYADKAYQNLIQFLAADPKSLNSQGAAFLPYLLSEIKNIEPSGRINAEFRLEKLKDEPLKDIYVNDKDKIFIPKFESSVYVFGEVLNPGAINYIDDKSFEYYIDNSGGTSRFASSQYIYIVSPDGIATRVSTKKLSVLFETVHDIYPGTVIYIPREVGTYRGVDFYATIAPIFSSLALSIASLNSIND